jgi:hypothetical protein
MTAALEGDEWLAARPSRNLPPVKTRYPFYRRLGGPQGRSGRAENPDGTRYPSMKSVDRDPASRSSLTVPSEPHEFVQCRLYSSLHCSLRNVQFSRCTARRTGFWGLLSFASRNAVAFFSLIRFPVLASSPYWLPTITATVTNIWEPG